MLTKGSGWVQMDLLGITDGVLAEERLVRMCLGLDAGRISGHVLIHRETQRVHGLHVVVHEPTDATGISQESLFVHTMNHMGDGLR